MRTRALLLFCTSNCCHFLSLAACLHLSSLRCNAALQNLRGRPNRHHNFNGRRKFVRPSNYSSPTLTLHFICKLELKTRCCAPSLQNQPAPTVADIQNPTLNGELQQLPLLSERLCDKPTGRSPSAVQQVNMAGHYRNNSEYTRGAGGWADGTRETRPSPAWDADMV